MYTWTSFQSFSEGNPQNFNFFINLYFVRRFPRIFFLNLPPKVSDDLFKAQNIRLFFYHFSIINFVCRKIRGYKFPLLPNDVPGCTSIASTVTLHCYTNDTQRFFSISELMASNRLKLNPSKSEFLWCITLQGRRLLD